jgi:hypothetical protein
MNKKIIIPGIKFRYENLKRYLRYLVNLIIPFQNFAILEKYGRTGNNLQQVALASLFSQARNTNFYYHGDEFFNTFEIINNNMSSNFAIFKKKYDFYFFAGKQKYINTYPMNKISEKYIYQNIESVFKDIIKPNLKFLKFIEIPDETLIIHIRSGDIFEKNKYPGYVQNPIDYYLPLIDKYKDCLIVTDKKQNNPVIPLLLKYDNVKIQSSDQFTDFNTLYSAKNLATSGVGTFPIAAALLSSNLENFYYSDYYLKEHLNPNMVNSKSINHYKIKIKNYIPDNQWKNTKSNLNKMISNTIQIDLPDNFN